MRGLVYLVAMSVKNGFLEVLRKPAKLIPYLILIVFLVGMVVLSNVSRGARAEFFDIAWLRGAFFLFILLFAVISVQKGLSNGNAIFGMEDVNLLFVSPIDSRAGLLYGLVRMTKTAFVTGFFILFQVNSLGPMFGLRFGAVLLLLCGFILACVLLFTLSLVLYSATNGRPARKTAVRLICVAALLPLAVRCLTELVGAADVAAALTDVIRSSVFAWTPVMGWVSAGTVFLLEGEAASGFLFLGLSVAALAALLAYIALSKPDYYEDVLVAAETAFEKKRNLAEGQINTEMSSSAKIRVAGTGIGGAGARAVFYKHLRESFRANRLGLWGLASILTVAGAALFAVFLRNSDGAALPIILQVLMWMQIFMIGTGRGLKELYMPYIYLIPESSFSKIVWSNLEITFKVLVESLLVFGVAGAISGENPLFTAACAAVYVLFSFLLLGVNYLFMRLTGVDLSAGLLLFLYFVAVLLVMLPGLGLGFLALAFVADPWGPLVCLGILAVWELAAGLTCFALSRSVLDCCDMPVVKPR
ncbi:MAG: putative ABC exporter domain-containing protein [Clostridiales Family XIII bacterium]|nr:putative ABC exporter domain-containing protein [Clostridiales Family XIII bacterium]